MFDLQILRVFYLALNNIYKGPYAWLVWLNWLLSCFFLLPWLAATFTTLIFKIHIEGLGQLLGAVSWLGMIALFEIGYALCIPALVAACAVLVMPTISWKIKIPTAAAQFITCGLIATQVWSRPGGRW